MVGLRGFEPSEYHNILNDKQRVVSIVNLRLPYRTCIAYQYIYGKQRSDNLSKLNLNCLTYIWKKNGSSTGQKILNIEIGVFAMHRDKNLRLDRAGYINQIRATGMARGM